LISSIIAVVLIQFLALLFFFLALVALMNNWIVWLVVFVVLGLMAEFLYYLYLDKCRKDKNREKKESKPEDSWVEPLYRNKGYTFDNAREIYLKQIGKSTEELTQEDERIIWGYAYDDFAYLLAWIIENDYYRPSKEWDEDIAREEKAFVKKIKLRKALPTDYLDGNEGYFMEDEVKDPCAYIFVKDYYNGRYLEDVKDFAKEKLNSELYGFPFRWEDYDVFKGRIDKSFEIYKRKIFNYHEVLKECGKEYGFHFADTGSLWMKTKDLLFIIDEGSASWEARTWECSFKPLYSDELLWRMAETLDSFHETWEDFKKKGTSRRVNGVFVAPAKVIFSAERREIASKEELIEVYKELLEKTLERIKEMCESDYVSDTEVSIINVLRLIHEKDYAGAKKLVKKMHGITVVRPKGEVLVTVDNNIMKTMTLKYLKNINKKD